MIKKVIICDHCNNELQKGEYYFAFRAEIKGTDLADYKQYHAACLTPDVLEFNAKEYNRISDLCIFKYE